MVRQLTVDFNRVIDGDLIRANARRAVPGTTLEVGSVVVVGDDDWGVVQAEVVEHDRETGSLVLRLLGELVDESAGELSRPHDARQAVRIDLVADLNAQDDDGFGRSLLSQAFTPRRSGSAPRPSTGNSDAVAVVRVVAVDDDGQVHFRILPAPIGKNSHLPDRVGASDPLGK